LNSIDQLYLKMNAMKSKVIIQSYNSLLRLSVKLQVLKMYIDLCDLREPFWVLVVVVGLEHVFTLTC